MEKIKQYGLKLSKSKPEDYIFGSALPMEIIQPDGDWTPYLPQREAQNLNGIEPYACATFTTLNCIEILIKKQYSLDRNYSDRFLAAISGTDNTGNSPQVVAEFLRKAGVVSEEIWPFSSDIDSFEKFYTSLPPKLYELAREFNEEWDFKHEYVPNNNIAIQSALQCSPLGISVTAWFKGQNDKYIQQKGMNDNHFTTLVFAKDGEYKRVFDSYDSFIKDYEWDSTHDIIKRYYIKLKNKSAKINIFSKLFSWLL